MKIKYLHPNSILLFSFYFNHIPLQNSINLLVFFPYIYHIYFLTSQTVNGFCPSRFFTLEMCTLKIPVQSNKLNGYFMINQNIFKIKIYLPDNEFFHHLKSYGSSAALHLSSRAASSEYHAICGAAI